ncbi:MAG: carbohydrate kinase [Rhodobacteraceae bacterium]|nr:carbohydrate kinase [Paracoccaceae bacterium]
MILCCGEALIDMLPGCSTSGQNCFVPHPGGAVFNTARALGRLGAPSGFFTAVAADMLGDLLIGALSEAGVDTGLVARVARPCTIAFVTLTDGKASYAFYDEHSAGRMLTVADLPLLPKAISSLFFGGISLVNDPAAAAYETLLHREAGARVIMLDPNIRPAFLDGREADYRPRIGRMIAQADIVKLSDEDMGWLMGAGDPLDQARTLLTQGPKLVFLTCGAKGAYAMTRQHCRHAPAHPAAVVDTVGAGDTFNAGALCALHEAGKLDKGALENSDGALLDLALNFATRAASVTVSRAGANPPWRREI